MNTENSKLKITEIEFNHKLILCSRSALASAVTSGVLVAVAVPIALSKLKFLRTSYEIRLTTGFFAAVTIGLYFAKHKRLECLENVQKNYTYDLNV